jgi:NAD-dependent deacetylase
VPGRAARRCDLLVAVGTALNVHPAAGLVPLASDHGADVVIVNAEPTPYDRVVGAVVRASIDEALAAIVGSDVASGERRPPQRRVT